MQLICNLYYIKYLVNVYVHVYLKDSQETEAPGSQELFDQESDHDQTVPVSEKLLKDIRKHINVHQCHIMYFLKIILQARSIGDGGGG